ncbi:solute carrier organic anion transporter family member 2B1 isoform X3 [Hemicordylus capensis]|uniref:solute carrier organic anion transporter family member 2B1 isoform X3 n=1 Tax=Hemicordylus capensis TaxID=884348 RepID=UPI0023045DFF|nr:solute carrier organic anion transporter family member 2B1 isoform X3 [Hemicordylus capensis]
MLEIQGCFWFSGGLQQEEKVLFSALSPKRWERKRASKKMPNERGSQFGRFYFKNPFYTVKFFVMCQGFLQLTQLLTSGFMKSSVSTIEKHFGLSSQTSGLIASFNEVGNTLLIIFVSYFGGRVHRPRLIGFGAILVCLAAVIISLPHFVTDLYEYDRSISDKSSNATDICLPNQPVSPAPDPCSENERRESRVVLILLFLGQILLGIGGVPIQPFGISYIDDFANRSNSPLYIGILFAATTIGPAIAFLLGSITLRYYVDIDKVAVADIQLSRTDPRWVGAWWLGFLVAAGLVALASVPYFFFPREMTKEEDITAEPMSGTDLLDEFKSKPNDGRDLTLWQFIKMFPVALLRNLKNPVFVMVILALINLSSMVAGLATFLSKYLERQFNLTAYFANMLIGSINIPGAMVGMVLGGAIMKSCHLSLRRATTMCIVSMGLSILLDFPLLFLGCPTQTVAGLDYTRSNYGIGQHVAECNKMCHCSPVVFNPVCGQDNIEYVSSCYAGCSVAYELPNSKTVMNYTRCNCILVNGAMGSAVPGSCSTQCSRFLIPFVLLASLAGFLASISHTPAFVLILRSVKPEDKSFAIGIQFLLLRVGAWLPAPVLFGSTIDTTCLLWQIKCEKKAACRYYDNTLFRQRFIGIQILFQLCCFVSFSVVYILLWRKEKQDSENKKEQSSEADHASVSVSATAEPKA